MTDLPTKQDIVTTLNNFYGTTVYTDFDEVSTPQLILSFLMHLSTSSTGGTGGPITGDSISVNNFPNTQAITGTVGINNYPETQTVTGAVTISNFPNSQTVTGTVNIGNFPNTQNVSGNVAITNYPESQSVIGTVDIGNFPATQPVSLVSLPLANNAATETTLASLVSKLPSSLSGGRLAVDGSGVTQPVSGNINISNFPATQNVVISSLPAGENNIGSVSIANLPSTQTVSGSVSVNNFPVTQPVSLSSLPSLSAGTNSIGSITNTSFASTQSGVWNLTNITGTISLPTGAATSSKQPNFGIAGTPSTDVLSIQGVVGGTPQTVTGTVAISNSFALDTTATDIKNRLPNSLGSKTANQSFPVTLSTDGIFATAFGTASDAMATSDTANTGHVSLTKRLLSKQTTLFQGVAGTPNTNVVTIQGITGGTPLNINNALAPIAGISGSRLITSANTWELLTSAAPLKSGIEVQAGTTNTGLLFVKYLGSTDGIALSAGNSRYFAISNTDQLHVSVVNANDRVRWMGS